MKIVFGGDGIRFYTEGILEELYLERWCLKHEGDMAKCVVSYEGLYTALEIGKVTERKAKDRVGLYKWPEEDNKVGEYDGIDLNSKGYILNALDDLIQAYKMADRHFSLSKEGLARVDSLKTQRETLLAEYQKEMDRI